MSQHLPTFLMFVLCLILLARLDAAYHARTGGGIHTPIQASTKGKVSS